jgi:hypothetical protein
MTGPLLSSRQLERSGDAASLSGEEACRANLTAQAGMTARLFCCLARRDSDLGVSVLY